MGILNFIEEAAGAVVAEKGLTAVDPDAGILAKGVAAIAGFEGVDMLKDKLGGLVSGDGAEAAGDDSAETDQADAA